MHFLSLFHTYIHLSSKIPSGLWATGRLRSPRFRTCFRVGNSSWNLSKTSQFWALRACIRGTVPGRWDRGKQLLESLCKGVQLGLRAMRSEPGSGGETAPGSSPFAVLFKTSQSNQSHPRPAKGSQSQPKPARGEKRRKGGKGERAKRRKRERE